MTLDELKQLTPKAAPSNTGGTLTLDQLKGLPPAASSVGPAPSAPSSPSMLDRISSGLDTFFGGSKIGNFIGTGIAKLGLGGLVGGVKNTPAERATVHQSVSPLQVAGDIGQIGLTLATAGGAGTAGKLPALVAKNAALGAGFGAAGSLKEGKSSSDVGKSTAIGGAVGGVLPLAGAALSKAGQFVTDYLPKRLVETHLPTQKDITQHILENTHLGTVSGMLKNSQEAGEEFQGQITKILTRPKYSSPKFVKFVGNGNEALQQTVKAFPNSEYTPDHVINTIKGLVPEQSKMVDKVAEGTATLLEKNNLRSALDKVLKKAYTSLSVLPANKDIGVEFSNALRNEVQSVAKETARPFAEWAKEITLQGALQKAAKRTSRIGLYDILSGGTGFLTHGPIGALTAIGLERAARSPAVAVGAAKGLNTLGKIAVPAGLKNATRTSILKGATTQ